MGNRKTYLTNQIVKYSQLLFDKGFVANHDGNASTKFDDVLLATPTAVSKGDIIPETVITLDREGKKIEGLGKPFSEIKLHLAAYQARPDVKTVMHAHPPFATARGLINLPLKPALPEAIVSIGDLIPVINFAMPGTPESCNLVADAFTQFNAIMIPGNGVLTVGDNLEQAYLRLELVEHLAKIEYYANQMGTPMMLSEENIQKLLEKRAAAGLDPKEIAKTKSIEAPTPSSNKPELSLNDAIKQLIAEEIKKAIT